MEAEPLIDPRVPHKLARACPLDIYLSGNDGGGEGATYFPWAYRMNKTTPDGNCESADAYRLSCDSFILDSAISDDEVTTDNVIAAAQKTRPDYVLPADVEHDQEKTTERVYEFLNLMDDAGIEATPIIPLQPDGSVRAGGHDEHFRDLEGLSTHYAIGGVKDAAAPIQRAAAESVRAVAGDEISLHGLGFGMGYLNDFRVAERPVLDSIDCSTPIQEARKGHMYVFEQGRLVRHEFPEPEGDFSLFNIAMASGTTLISLVRQVMETESASANADLSSFGMQTAVPDGGRE